MEPVDGCFNFLFSCEEECDICKESFGEKCISWSLVGGDCVPNCGDVLLVSAETCHTLT